MKSFRYRFGALLEGGEAAQDVLRLARQKLRGTSAMAFVSTPLTGRLAILDILLQLDYENLSEFARKTQLAMIEGNMRLGYSVTYKREVLRSGYSSEPVLAEAAHAQLFAWDSDEKSGDLDHQYNVLEEIICTPQGLLDYRKNEDLIGRALIMKAFRKAV